MTPLLPPSSILVWDSIPTTANVFDRNFDKE